jgi:hypothetical protein
VPLGKLTFYGVDGPALPFPTVFNNRWWNTEYLDPFPLGGQVPRPRGYNGLWKIPGIVLGHYCGTPEMFMEGYDPAVNPPTPAGPGVLPPCCPSPLGGRVAAAVWPSSVVSSWRGPTYPIRAQYQLGGSVPYTVAQYVAPTGGYQIRQFQVQPAYPVPVPAVLGGQKTGGLVPFQIRNALPPAGGYRVGGPVAFQVTNPLPPAGGYRVGGPQAFQVTNPLPPAGGYRVGGPQAFQVTQELGVSGGYRIGGSVGIDMAGSINTTHDAGGPVTMNANVQFVGTGPLHLVVSGQTITWSLGAIGPAPGAPTSLGATASATAIAWSWTAPTGLPPAGYALLYGPTSTYPTGAVLVDAGNVLTYTTSGLTGGTSYSGQAAGYYNGLSGPLSNTASATPQTIDVLDNFHDVNNTLLSAHTPDVHPGGSAWAQVSGQFSIQGNTLQNTSGTSTGSTVYWIDSGRADMTLTASLTTGTVNTGAGIGTQFDLVFRFQDSSNYWLLQSVSGSSGNQFNLIKQVAGVFTTVSTTSFTPASSTGYALKVVCSGSSITATVNGGHTLTASDSALSTKTGVGIFDVIGTGGTGTTWTQFEVVH